MSKKTALKKKKVTTKAKVKKKTGSKKKTTTKTTKKTTGKRGRKPLVGKTTGKSVSEMWGALFGKQMFKRLDDTKLATAMRKEFPKAKKYDEADVLLFRNRYNNGRLDHQMKNGKPTPPKKRVPQFEKGKALPLWGTGKRSKK